jgi:hypothetical protein
MLKEKTEEIQNSRLFGKLKMLLEEYELGDAKQDWKRLDLDKRADVLMRANDELNTAIKCFNNKNFDEASNLSGQIWAKLALNEEPLFSVVKIRTLGLLIESRLNAIEIGEEVIGLIEQYERIDGGSFDAHFFRLFYIIKLNMEDEMVLIQLDRLLEFLNRPHNPGNMERKDWVERYKQMKKLRKGMYGKSWKRKIIDNTIGPRKEMIMMAPDEIMRNLSESENSEEAREKESKNCVH